MKHAPHPFLAPAAAFLILAAGCGRSGDAAGGGGRRGAQGGPVPVVAGKVEKRDTPIYLDGIGTVQAFNTVTVRAQVDGTLQQVAFQEGQEVKSGDVLAVVDPRPYQAQYDQAKAKKAEDLAQLGNATVTYERNHTLLEKGLVDQQTVDTQKAAMEQARAAVQADDAALEQAGVQLGYTQIRAPLAGRTGIRQVDQGNVVHAADTGGIVVITQLRPISVLFTLPQQDWPQISRLMAKGERLPALAVGDDARNPLDRGTLSVVDNQIDPSTGTIKLKATFPNQKLALWPGQFVNVRLLVETRKDGLVVPASVIQRGPQGAYAFVIQADQTAVARPVQVAQIDGGYALLDQGLSEGEQVVVDGQYKLQTGSHVTTAAPSLPGGGQRRRPASATASE